MNSGPRAGLLVLVLVVKVVECQRSPAVDLVATTA